MLISVSIMAHPKRKAAAEALYDQLKQYPFSDVVIIWDELNSEWHTGKRALKGGAVLGSQWHVVIQDDALLTPNFYENIRGAIEALPVKTIISLYTGQPRPLGQRVSAAIKKATHGDFLESIQLYWGVGLVIPSDQIEQMLEFVEDIELPYDNKVGEYYCQNGMPVYYTYPSLVNHDDDKGSLLGHGADNTVRVAYEVATGPVTWTGKSHYI